MPEVIRDQKVYLGALDLGGELHSIRLGHRISANDDARLGDATAKKAPGRSMTEFELAGFWDPINQAAKDSQLFADVGATRAYIIDLRGAGEGGVCYFGDILVTGRPLDIQHGNQAGMTIAGATRNSPPVRGLISELGENISASEDGVALNLGAVATGEKLAAAICMFGSSAPNVSVDVESDDNPGFTTPTVRMSFTALTANGGEYKTVAGPITDTYYRIAVTVTSGTGIYIVGAVGIL